MFSNHPNFNVPRKFNYGFKRTVQWDEEGCIKHCTRVKLNFCWKLGWAAQSVHGNHKEQTSFIVTNKWGSENFELYKYAWVAKSTEMHKSVLKMHSSSVISTHRRKCLAISLKPRSVANDLRIFPPLKKTFRRGLFGANEVVILFGKYYEKSNNVLCQYVEK